MKNLQSEPSAPNRSIEPNTTTTYRYIRSSLSQNSSGTTTGERAERNHYPMPTIQQMVVWLEKLQVYKPTAHRIPTNILLLAIFIAFWTSYITLNSEAELSNGFFITKGEVAVVIMAAVHAFSIGRPALNTLIFQSRSPKSWIPSTPSKGHEVSQKERSSRRTQEL
ncbi:hypothetical protein TWF706_003643 [Orbilia oligospora]|nr:hypothetical protein TWF706_003643 [Orbilia oligospora]